MRIFVLGGAGNMGSIATQILVGDDRVDEVVIGDVNVEQALVVADYLGSPKITVQHVDLREEGMCRAALAGASACINATIYYHNLSVMEVCLAAGVPYVDLGGLFHTTRKQLELDQRFQAAGLSAVLGMGSAPGIPNVQARYAAERLDTIDAIRIYDGIKPPPSSQVAFTYAVPTILDELFLAPMVYRQGEFLACAPLSEFEEYAFTAPIGSLPMHLSLHSEVATLPLTFVDKGVGECWFKINYWGMAPETVAKIKTLADFGFDSREPVQVRGQQVAPRDVMMALLGKYTPPITDYLAPPNRQPPDWVKEIVTEVQGAKDGRMQTYRLGTLTVKSALPTGAAPAIVAIWLAQGRIPPGVHPPEAVIDPVPFFAELDRLGIPTTVGLTQSVL